MNKHILPALLALGLSGPAAADDACRPVVATGETFFNGAGFDGLAWTSLGDATAGDFGERTVSVALLGQKETGNGLLAATSHTFSGPDGSFSTRDNARLEELSPGLYRLDTQATIVAGAWGHLTIDGMVDFRLGWARWFARGEVCGL